MTLSTMFAKWLHHGDEVIAAARKLASVSFDEYGTADFERIENDEDGLEPAVLAGGIFANEEQAKMFLEALTELLAVVEGLDE